MNNLPTEVSNAVERWLALDVDPVTSAEVHRLADQGNEAQLRNILLSGRLTFGTAGLRAAMGPGYTRMNQVTVAQSACGLASYLKDQFTAAECSSRGVLVGYDARHLSERFARITASVMLSNGIRCRITRTHCPTPWVAFGVRQFSCIAGVMVTASHNPKNDNGYKVYWDGGSQIVPPHDTGIAQAIEKSLDIDKAVCFGESWQSAEDVLDSIDQGYFEGLRLIAAPHREVVQRAGIDIVYTAMHGVGGRPILTALKELAGVSDAHLHLVQEQFSPDPDFPTVVFPNPEEGKSSMDLAIKKAVATGSTIIIANDPDADRLAIAERAPDGTYHLFTGNELGALLGWWMLRESKDRGDDLRQCIMLSSTVSSRILGTMAAEEGFQFEETLTGFKWMGTLATAAEKERGLTPLFAFEEAIGFMCGGRVRDKDGITAATVAVAMAAWTKTHLQRSLLQQLNAIYAKYGYHHATTSYVTSRDAKVTQRLFADIRTWGPHGYPSTIGGLGVLHVRDLGAGIDTRQSDRRPILPCDALAPVLTFYLERDVKLTIRGSGTEPKLKWYCEAVARSEEEAASLCEKVSSAALHELLRPAHYGFELRA